MSTTGQGRRRGMAMMVVLSVVFVLSAFMFALVRYQRHHIQVTGATTNAVSALAAAESGLAVARAEIEADPTWATHEITGFDADGEVIWGGPVTRALKTRPAAGFELTSSGQGTVEGAVGTAPYRAEFKVRAGFVPDAGGTSSSGSTGRTRTRYLHVESLGLKTDPTGRLDRATRVTVMVERLNFTEFLIYDGGWLTLGMGSENDPDSVNIFADGRLYGHRWVHLGDISTNGTRQRWVNLASIRSAGEIDTASDYRIHFQADPDFGASTSSQPGFEVHFHPGNDSDSGNLETARGRITDGNRGGALSPPQLDQATIEALAGTIPVHVTKAASMRTEAWNSYPEFDSRQFVEIDFGRALYGSGAGDDHLPEGLNAPYGPDFNKIIFCPGDVVVWGAPDRDITIFAGGDIFVAGDFNVRETHRQDYEPDFVSEINPDDNQATVREAPYYSYVHRERFTTRDLPGGSGWDLLPEDQRDRRSCALIAMGNVWRDYRLPGRFMRNELLGLMAWELGEALADRLPPPAGTPPQQWKEELQEKLVELESDGRPAALDVAIPGYAGAGLTPDADGIPQLTGVAGLIVDAMFPWTPSDAEDPQESLCRAPNCGGLGQVQLADARATPPRVPGYWLRWYVTKESKVEINRLVGQALDATGGRVTDELLWGDGGSDPGLLWKIYGHLLEDERRWQEFQGIGLPGGIQPANTTRLALGNAPQRLYNLVRDERGTDVLDRVGLAPGETPNTLEGKRSDRQGQQGSMQNDRLWMPQMTINAMILVNSKKNDRYVPGGDPDAGNLAKLQDATSVDRRFYELGNPRAQGLHYLSTLRSRNGLGGNIIAPFVQRLRGSYIRYAQGDARPPQMRSGFYWPPIRRRIFDPALVKHPPPMIPSKAKVRSWFHLGATPAEFEAF